MYDFSVVDVFGILGVCIYIGAYTGLQLGFLRGQGYSYASLNMVAALLVLLSLKDNFNLSSTVIQVSWITISVVGIIRFYILSRRSRFTDNEQEFLGATMPGLPPIPARRLLNIGTWHTKEAGTGLTEQHKENEHLVYLQEGSAYVTVDGHVIARLEGGSFIGELALLTGAPASATVELGETSHYLEFPVGPLRRVMERDSEVFRHLRAALSGQVMEKLVRSTRDLVDFTTN